jgi:acyl-CoA dehydrogenase
MTEDVALFRDNVRKVFEREFAPLEERWRRQHLADRSVWRQAGEMGLLCTSIPEAYGGGGGSFAHEAVVAYEQGRALVNSFSLNVHSGIVAHYLLAYGSEAQKLRWLPKMATGELVAAATCRRCAPALGAMATSTSSTAPRPSSPTATMPTWSAWS